MWSSPHNSSLDLHSSFLMLLHFPGIPQFGVQPHCLPPPGHCDDPFPSSPLAPNPTSYHMLGVENSWMIAQAPSLFQRPCPKLNWLTLGYMIMLEDASLVNYSSRPTRDSDSHNSWIIKFRHATAFHDAPRFHAGVDLKYIFNIPLLNLSLDILSNIATAWMSK